MILDKKVIARISTMAVLCTMLTGVAVSYDTQCQRNAECEAQGLLTSAGALGHINPSGDLLSAGVMNTVMDETVVGVVEVEPDNVAQGNPEAEETPVENDLSKYDTFGYTNLGLAVVDGNLNVRKTPGMDGEIIGKMTNYAACEILGEENGWYKITSGNLEGYISAEYVITGEEALIIAQEEAKLMVTVTTDTLNVRKGPSVDTDVLTTVSKDADLYVLEVLDGWVKIELDRDEAYISSEFVTLSNRLKTGNTLKELQFGEGISETRVNLVNLALQYVGNRYVWGGESLEHGVDCSGFTMKIYEQFGVYLTHYSGTQPYEGTIIPASEAKPGDLFFYGEGSTINHVAIYIGNGQIVHASSTRDGIKISNAFYRTPICVAKYLD